MSVAATCARELRSQLARFGRLAPSSKNPDRFHEDKSDIAFAIAQVCDILEGNFEIVDTTAKPAKPAKPAPKKQAPYTIEDRRGNVVHVDFKRRRVTKGPGPDPR